MCSSCPHLAPRLRRRRHEQNDKIVLCCFHQIYLIEKRVKLKVFLSASFSFLAVLKRVSEGG